MRLLPFVALLIALGLIPLPQVFGRMQRSINTRPPALLAEEEDSDEGPPEVIVRKLGAMSAEQNFKRGESIKSDGKVAPKDVTIYPIEITDAEGKTVLKVFFFKSDNGKWSIYDEAGNVMRETGSRLTTDSECCNRLD